MKRFQSILCASFLTLAISATAFAGDIHGAPSAGDIHGAPSAGDIHGIKTAGDIHGAPSAGDIHGLPGSIYDSLLMFLASIV